jgi:tRNA threonylcarbamoyladenosine modification (KEOPS) complex  Pcc1 subunit
MRIHVMLRNLPLLLVLTSPLLLRAQFQEPTPEELKMTADPKAPGAAAVYLYYEETADAQDNTAVLYERIKVLTEKGKEKAIVNIPYERGVDKIGKIEGRTIHSDGTVIPLKDKPSDLMDVKTKDYQLNSIVFTLPDAEVGCILEFRVILRRDSDWTYIPKWQVQREYFVHKAHYSFRHSVNQEFMWTGYLSSEAKVVKGRGEIISLDISDIPAEPSEDWMPPLNTLRWRVNFFFNIKADKPEEFWKNTREHWANWIADFIKPTNPIKKAAAGIVASGDTDEQKARKIYEAVQKLDNTDFSRVKSDAERKKEKLKDIVKAEDVWKQQSGSSDDIALLYASLATAVGLKALPAYVVNRDLALFDFNYLSNSQFDDNIVAIELDGRNVFVDPGQKMCPFGFLHWKHTLASGFLFQGKGAIFTTTPSVVFKDSKVLRVADLDIDESGSLKGTVRFMMTGPEALYWRQLALENDEAEVKKQFVESMRGDLPEGVQAEFDHFQGLDDSSVNLAGFVNVSGSLGSVTGKHFFLSGLFFETRAKHPFVAQDKRVTPIDLHYPKMIQDDVVYHLPAGYTVESAPKTSDVTWPNHAILRIASGANGSTVRIQRAFIRNFTLLDSKEYNDLHDFYLKLSAADQQQLVLTRVKTEKAN